MGLEKVSGGLGCRRDVTRHRVRRAPGTPGRPGGLWEPAMGPRRACTCGGCRPGRLSRGAADTVSHPGTLTPLCGRPSGSAERMLGWPGRVPAVPRKKPPQADGDRTAEPSRGPERRSNRESHHF